MLGFLPLTHAEMRVSWRGTRLQSLAQTNVESSRSRVLSMLEQTSLRISEEMPPPLALFQAATGYWASQAIYVAAKLGIADLLKEGPSTCGDLAQATATHAPSLCRLMHALTSLGIFAAEEDHRFALTPIGRSLQSGV